MGKEALGVDLPAKGGGFEAVSGFRGSFVVRQQAGEGGNLEEPGAAVMVASVTSEKSNSGFCEEGEVLVKPEFDLSKEIGVQGEEGKRHAEFGKRCEVEDWLEVRIGRSGGEAGCRGKKPPTEVSRGHRGVPPGVGGIDVTGGREGRKGEGEGEELGSLWVSIRRGSVREGAGCCGEDAGVIDLVDFGMSRRCLRQEGGWVE